MNEIYARLTEHFDTTHKLTKGNAELDYLTLEQVASRLNDVLGVDGWDFSILGHGQDAGHCWVQGELRVYFETRAITRQQFGECAIQRGMALGDSRKGACSDAIKKCASLIGVGLYLSVKEEHADAEQRQTAPSGTGARKYEEVWKDPASPLAVPLTVACADCGNEIKSNVRKDGTTWTAAEKATYSRNKYGRVLCYPCGQGKAS